jgi:Stress responsive A/B Barrel Domain
MLHHVVVITLKDDVTDSQVDAVLEGFGALPAAIPEIRAYDFGRDAGLSQNRFSLALVAKFDSVEDFTVYRDHASHQAFVRDLLGPVAESRESTQFFSRD